MKNYEFDIFYGIFIHNDEGIILDKMGLISYVGIEILSDIISFIKWFLYIFLKS